MSYAAGLLSASHELRFWDRDPEVRSYNYFSL
jgi:hypothetical protein